MLLGSHPKFELISGFIASYCIISSITSYAQTLHKNIVIF